MVTTVYKSMAYVVEKFDNEMMGLQGIVYFIAARIKLGPARFDFMRQLTFSRIPFVAGKQSNSLMCTSLYCR